MAWKFTDLPYRMRKDPEELRDFLFRLVDESRGNITMAAEALDLSRRMLYYYIDELGMRAEVIGLKDKYKVARRRGQTAGASHRGTQNEFLAMMHKDPKEAMAVMQWAFEDSGGDFNGVARSLGIRNNILSGLVTKLGLEETVQRIRQARAEKLRNDVFGGARRAS